MGVRASILAAMALVLAGCTSEFGYLPQQGRFLLADTLGARRTRSMIAAPDTPADTREFLLRVQEIRDFAARSIGLRDNGAYTRFKEIPGDHLVDVVSACDAVAFTPYLWGYPFLGRLPYRGYYRTADAEREAERLRQAGYDVLIRPVDAFSTLGFLKDPLYSFMESYTPFDLASLIIHEQTHATIFLKGQPDFNEELATFVGTEGAMEWLRARYGERSPELQAAVDANADERTLEGLLHDLATELDRVYRGPESRGEKLARKAAIIDGFRARLRSEARSLFRTEDYRRVPSMPINNAVISLYRLYTGDDQLLRSFFEKRCSGSLPRLIEATRRLAAHGDVLELMRQEVAMP
jgi:predicted aminopeptidase